MQLHRDRKKFGEAGAELAIVNATETPLDDVAAVVVRGRAGELLPEAVALARGLTRPLTNGSG